MTCQNNRTGITHQYLRYCKALSLGNYYSVYPILHLFVVLLFAIFAIWEILINIFPQSIQVTSPVTLGVQCFSSGTSIRYKVFHVTLKVPPKYHGDGGNMTSLERGYQNDVRMNNGTAGSKVTKFHIYCPNSVIPKGMSGLIQPHCKQ